MATYTKSTGYELKEAFCTVPYNSTGSATTGQVLLYTVPEGKFAIISQVWLRTNITSNGNSIYINFYKNAPNTGQWVTSPSPSGNLFASRSDENPVAQFTNTLSPYGQWSASSYAYNSNTANQIGTSSECLRIMSAGESLYVKQRGSAAYVVYARLEYYEFTPQV